MFTETMRDCLDVTDADYEIADCFLDGIIGNKGWLSLGIDYVLTIRNIWVGLIFWVPARWPG